MNYLHRIQAVVVLDYSGKRIFAKYYAGEDAPDSSKALASVDRQRALEYQIQLAVRNPSTSVNSIAVCKNEILIVDGHTVIYQFGDDITFLVIGDGKENEVVLSTVLTTFVEALRLLLNVPVLSGRQLLENYEALLLTVDEMLDEGIILETNKDIIAAEVEPYIAETGGEAARKALSSVNKYLRENL